jgi:type IV pilus assembly protein PilC
VEAGAGFLASSTAARTKNSSRSSRWPQQARQPRRKPRRNPNFSWEGKNKPARSFGARSRAASEAAANAGLRRQGITVSKLKKRKSSPAARSRTRTSRSSRASWRPWSSPAYRCCNPSTSSARAPTTRPCQAAVRHQVRRRNRLQPRFRLPQVPQYFDALFCNLVEAGEQAGILDTLLDRLATYKEKIQAIKSKIKGALFYPIAILWSPS